MNKPRKKLNCAKKFHNVQLYWYWRYRLRIRLRQERARKRTTDFLVVPSACLTDLTRKHGYAPVFHIPNMVDIDMDDDALTSGGMIGKSSTVETNAVQLLDPWDSFAETKPEPSGNGIADPNEKKVWSGLSEALSELDTGYTDLEVLPPSGIAKNLLAEREEWEEPMEGPAGELIRAMRAEVEEDWNSRRACNALNGNGTRSFPPGKKRLLYYCGAIRSGKGVFWLLENYRQQDYQNLELHLVGPLELDDEDRAGKSMWRNEATDSQKKKEYQTERFYRLLKESGAIYEGEVNREELIRRLREAYAVIIPSIAFENYPNVGLEAIVCNCLVCGAENGGIPEMVGSEKLLFRRDSQCGATIRGRHERRFVGGNNTSVISLHQRILRIDAGAPSL